MFQRSINGLYWRPRHPLSVAVYVSALAVTAMVFTHPLYLLLLGAILLFHVAVFNGWEKWKDYIRTTSSYVVLFVAINVLVNGEGETVIWKMPALVPGLGVKISLEEIYYNLRLCSQMLMLLTCFLLYSIMQDVDSVLKFLLRVAPRSTLTLILTSLLVPLVRRRLSDAEDALICRGARFEKGGLLDKIRARLPLIKIALQSCLEGSWETTEALEARAYGVGPRTSLRLLAWQTADIAALCLGLSIWAWLGITALNGEGKLSYFPVLEPVFNSVRVSSMAFIFVVSTALPVACLCLRRFHENF
ncbi:MAG: hypothetical protein HY587_05755 [Candidatus Omnitrophica bacterium]|nr:hypothetical protein [Candidatus Omnitrophota bacterium]